MPSMCQALESCGEIDQIRITRRLDTEGIASHQQIGPVYAHVDFKNSDGLEAALVLGGLGLEIGDALVRVRQASSISKPKPVEGKSFYVAGERPETCDTVFVGNLPFGVTEASLRGLLQECGPIAAVRWGEEDGVFKGFAHVAFSLQASTEKAVALSGEVSDVPILAPGWLPFGEAHGSACGVCM